MKINEIDAEGEDATILAMKGIKYDFEKQINKIDSELMLINGMPATFPNYTKFYNMYVLKNMKLIMDFLNTCKTMNIPTNDPHCIKASEIYNDLLKIRKP